ncbi:MAG: hypothetical protein QM811_30270 [Pirellulales bacterium]
MVVNQNQGDTATQVSGQRSNGGKQSANSNAPATPMANVVRNGCGATNEVSSMTMGIIRNVAKCGRSA